MTHISGLTTRLITTHGPPSKLAVASLLHARTSPSGLNGSLPALRTVRMFVARLEGCRQTMALSLSGL